MIDAADPCQNTGGQIAFSTNRSGGSEVARVLADGTNIRLLTSDTREDNFPSWSPDGTRLAWLSYHGAQPELYVMNSDGSGAQDVSAGAAEHYRWSPDGTHLVFTSNRDGNNEVYMVQADGSGLTNLTANAASDAYPDWSPDGTKIVFISNRNGRQLVVMNADGSAPMALADLVEDAFVPR